MTGGAQGHLIFLAGSAESLAATADRGTIGASAYCVLKDESPAGFSI